MKRFALLSTLIFICAGLSACASKNHFSSWTSNSDNAYLKAKSTPKLKVPADLSSAKVGDSFNIPSTTSQGPVPIAKTPPGGIFKTPVSGDPKTKSSSGYFLKPLF
jgi:uncharacterized lipoprotein